MKSKFNPKDFLTLAKEISEDSEANIRTIINRSYYSSFGYVKQSVPQFHDESAGVHAGLIKLLKNSSNTTRKIAGSNLEDLFKSRKKADYDYHESSIAGYGKFSILKAEKIMKLFEESIKEESLED